MLLVNKDRCTIQNHNYLRLYHHIGDEWSIFLKVNDSSLIKEVLIFFPTLCDLKCLRVLFLKFRFNPKFGSISLLFFWFSNSMVCLMFFSPGFHENVFFSSWFSESLFFWHLLKRSQFSKYYFLGFYWFSFYFFFWEICVGDHPLIIFVSEKYFSMKCFYILKISLWHPFHYTKLFEINSHNS